jgi:hypothetical protein
MNLAGASVWGRLLTWLEHEQTDGFERLKRKPVGIDTTAALDTFSAAGKLVPQKAHAAFDRVAHRLRASHILFVPAVLSGVALKASRLRVVEYLTHVVRQLRENGFDASIADIDTGAPIAANGARLAQIIADAHRPTWIVTHSKGGVDTLEALLVNPDVRRFVDGWIAFQAPFYGSPVADVASGTKRARRLSGAALRLLSAETEAIGDLRTDTRARYMDRRASDIARLVEEVPIVCVATASGASSSRATWWPDLPTGRWMASLGLKNDGMVPVNSAILPGARFVTLDGLGHGQVATNHILLRNKLENVDLLKALFALMLDEGSESKVAAA